MEPLAPQGSWASSAGARAVMRGNKGRDTGPEMAVRSALHRRGLRFRVQARPLPELRRTADVVFRPARVAVFVDGCFWHGCPKHGTQPTRNRAYWSPKIARNRERDRETDALLLDAGWLPVRVWEHEDVADAIERIAAVVAGRRPGGPAAGRLAR